MSGELNFEAMPFGFQELLSEQGDLEGEEEIGRRGRSQTRSTRLASRSQRSTAQRQAPASKLAKSKFSRLTQTHGPQHKHWWPRVATGAYGFAPEPYPIAPAAYPASTRSEYIRWVQSALNDVLGLQLPTNGYAGPATRDAIRTFQQQSGIPADGVVGPDTERALLAARAQQSGPGGPPTPPGPAGPPPPPPPSAEPPPAAAAPAEPPPAAPGELNFEWESLGQEWETTQASAERDTVRSSIAAGQRDASALADLVFFRRHPERRGRRIAAGEQSLADEWTTILRTIVLPELGSAGARSGAGATGGDREVAQTLAMAKTPAPKLGISLEQLLVRHQAEWGGIPIEVLLAFIHYEAGRLFDDATAGNWSEKYKTYSPSFYELGVFQTPAGQHGCANESGVKTCKYPPPGRNVENSQFGKGWRRLAGVYPTADTWKNPTMQVRVGLWDLNSTADTVVAAFPDLFPSKQSEWWLRVAVLYSFAAGGGAARAFLRRYRQDLLALPEAKRWDFLRGKSVGAFTFNPENVDKKMALAAKLRNARRAQAP